MESLTDNVSLSWWYKDQTKNKNITEVDLSKVQQIAIARNMERLVGNSLGGPKKAARDFFLSVAAGKVPLPPDPVTGAVVEVKPPLVFDLSSAEDITPKAEWSAILQNAIQMSSLVLKPGTAPKFFYELVRGRFGKFDE